MTNRDDAEDRAASALARALEGDAGGESPPSEDDAEVGELVRLADRVRASAGFAPPLDPTVRDALVDAALDRAAPRRRGTLYWIAGAVAAAFVLFVVGILYTLGSGRSALTSVSGDLAAAGAGPRDAFAAPTDELFDEPFPEGQSPAERLDRIVEARTRGYFSALIMERSGASQRSSAALGRARRGTGLSETDQVMGSVWPW